MSKVSTALRATVAEHLAPAEAAALAFLGMTIFLWSVQAGSVQAGPVPKLSLTLWILEALLSLVIWGRLALLAGGLRSRGSRSLILELLTGMVIVSGLLTAGRLLADLSLLHIWWTQLFVGLGLYGLFAPRIGSWRAPSPAALLEGLGVVLSCLGASAWTRIFRPGWGSLDDGRVLFRFINDYYLHSQFVWLLSSDASAAELGRTGLAGQPIPLYHYAGYALTGCMSAHTGVPTLDGMFSFWLPFGFLLVGLAGCALAREWFGVRAVVPAVTLLIVLPDPTLLPLLFRGQPGFSYYSFLRFLVYAPSNMYGIAAAATGLAWLCAGIRRQSIRRLAVGVLLGAAALFFKAQPFLPAALLAIALLSIFLVGQAYQARGRITGPVLGFLAGLVGLLGLGAYLWGPVFLERAPPVELARPPGRELAEFLFSRVHAEPISGWLVHQGVSQGGILGLFCRVLLVLYLPLRGVGAGLLLAALAIDLAWGRRSLAPIWKRVSVWIALAIYLGFALLLAPNRPGYAWGNPWDYQLVTFAWMYFVVFVWSVGRLAQWPPLRRFLRPASAFALSLVLLIPAYRLGGIPLDDNGMTAGGWGGALLPEGLVECAQYLRGHTHPADRIQESENDCHLIVEPIAQRRSFVGWPVVGSYTAKDQTHELFLARLEVHRRFQEARTASDIENFLAVSGVRWYLLTPESRVVWRQHIGPSAVFTSDGFQVIDLWHLARHLAEEG